MDCIKRQDLRRGIIKAVICLLLIWPFLFGFSPVFAIEVLPRDPVIFPDPDRETNKKVNTRVVSNGQGYLCIWQEQDKVTGEDILGQIVDPNGTLEGGIIHISKTDGSQTSPDLDTDGSSYLVVWSDGRDPSTTDSDIYGALVSADGTISVAIPIETGPGDLKFPRVKWNGTHYLVAWEDWEEHDPSTKFKVSIYGKRVDTNGQVVEHEPEGIAIDYAFNEKGIRAGFDLASLEDPNIPSWLIVWNGYLLDPSIIGFDILGRFLYEDPNEGLSFDPLPSFQIPIQTDQYYPSIEGLGNRFLVVWENWMDEEGSKKDILGIQLDPLGNILDGLINISSAPNNQTLPEVASNGQGYFVVWLDRRDSQPGQVVEHVYGARISPEGLVLNDDPDASNGTRISADPNQTPWSPAVASRGPGDDRYFPLWSIREGTDWSLIGRIYDPPPPPGLEWVDIPGYEEDGVDPDSTFGGSSFTFKVKYVSHEEINAPPEIAQLWIDLDDNGSPGREEVFDMTGEGGPVTDYTAGRVYSYQNPGILYDGDGVLIYRFLFADKYNVATGEPTLYNTFQVNMDGNQPTLSWTDEPGFTEDGSRPDGAEWGTDTPFEFRVIYRDKDGDEPPQSVELWIDKDGDGVFDPNHEKWGMQADGAAYQQGQIYTKSVTLKSDRVRSIIYKFESHDGKNRAVGDPRRPGGYISFNPLGEVSACLNTQHQFFPSIASTGSGYQVFWQDQREKETDANDVLIARSHIWMELLSQDGQVRDGPGEPGQWRIDTGSVGAFKPLARFDPETQRTLVIWEDLRYGSIIQPKGDEKNIFKPEAIYEGLDIYGTFMDASGVVMDPNGEPVIDPDDPNSGFLIGGSASERNMLNPDMAVGDNGQYIIVWESESRIEQLEETEIFARFVRYPEGAYGEMIWIRIAVEGRDFPDEFPGERHQLMPRVAWNGEYYLAVWQDIASVDPRTGYYFSRVYGIRIEPNGELYPPVLIDPVMGDLRSDTGYVYEFFNEEIMGDPNINSQADPNSNQLFPDVASDGENFLIVWQDRRFLEKKGGYNIYGMRVNINESAIQYLDHPHREIPICTADGDQIRPRVFWDPQAGQYLIMWLEVPYELSPADMLLPRISGSIKAVRMDPNGQLMDDKEDKYKGTGIIGIPASQDRPDMVCDPGLGCRLIWEDLRSSYSYDIYTTSFQSTLNWVDDPNFEDSGVYPIRGEVGGSFTFKVEYRDRSDTPPGISQVWIDLDDSGIFEAGEKFDMEAADPDAPVSKGLIYTYVKEIGPPQDPNSDGIIAYRFYFQNEEDQKAQGVGSNLKFLSLVGAPQLDWTAGPGFTTDGVDPNQADSGTEFRFSVTYTDTSGALPFNRQIWIDQDDNGEYGPYERHLMEEDDPADTDSSDGKVYTFAMPLFYRGDGVIKYQFFFDNGVVEAEGEPASDTPPHTLTIIKTSRDELWRIYTQDDGLAGNSATSLAIDQNNIVWAGFTPNFEDPNAGGVSSFDGQTWQTFKGPEYLPNNYVTSLAISPDNHLWAATSSGIGRFDGHTWDTGIDPNNDYINMIVSGKDGHIWADIYSLKDPNTFGDPNALVDPNASEFYGGGLARYDSGGWTFYKRETMGGDFITALAIDANGIVWAGILNLESDPNGRINLVEYKGIVLFDPDSGKVIRRFSSSEDGYTGGNLVRAIYIDESGDIWVGSQDPNQISEFGSLQGMGLSHYNSNQEEWTRYLNGENGVSLGSNVVTAIDRREDDLWLGHGPESEGLIGGATYHNLSTGTWQVLNSNDSPLGDAFNIIYDLAVDAEGSVWFATFNGIARYFPPNTILTFTDSGFVNGVSPGTGVSGTGFEFRVQYRDEGNAPPDKAQVWIDLDNNDNYENDEKFDMVPLDPNDKNYIDGVVYSYDKIIEFEDGADISYRFYFEKDGSPVLGTPAEEHHLTIVESKPYLDWAGGAGFSSDGVEPDQGESGDEFIFRVKYVNPENEPPDQGKSQVWIDMDADDIYEGNEKFNMVSISSEDTDYTDGRIYRYAINLSYAGNGRIKYRFYFVAEGSEVTGNPSADHYLFIVQEKFWVTYTTADNLSSNIITSLVLDNQGRIWAGTIYQVVFTTETYYDNDDQDTQPDLTIKPGGVNIYDGDNWTSYYEKDPNAFGFNAIICMTKDQNGNIWAGTANGIIKYTNADPSQKVYYTAKNATEWGSNLVTALAADADNDIWIGTHPALIDPNAGTLSGGGLTLFDGQNWTRYDPSVLGSNLIIALDVDKDKKVWMGLANLSFVQGTGELEGQLEPQYIFHGLAILDPETEVITRYRSSDTPYLDDDHISAISIQENGDIWIATGENLIMKFGLSMYSPNLSTFGMGLTYYSNGEWKQKFNSGNTSGEMPANNVTALFVHEGSDIWMGILEDDPNKGGINHFDHSEEEWEWFTPENVIGELSSHFITDILVDDNGDMWAATFNGVSRYSYTVLPFDDSGSLDIIDAYGKIGYHILIPVQIQNTPNSVHSFSFEITYDPYLLEYKGFFLGECIKRFDFFDVFQPEGPGMLRIGGFELGDHIIQSGSDCIITFLEFKVIGCKGFNYASNLAIGSLEDDFSDWCYSGGRFICINDEEPPVPDIDPLPAVIAECEVTLDAPTATDEYAGVISATTDDPLIYAEQGIYTVTWVYDDGFGNSVSQEQTIVIMDETAPSIITVDAGADKEIKYGQVATLMVTATDNCGDNLVYEWREGRIILGEDSILTYKFGRGTHEVKVTVMDEGGNAVSDMVEFEVKGEDSTYSSNIYPSYYPFGSDNYLFPSGGFLYNSFLSSYPYSYVYHFSGTPSPMPYYRPYTYYSFSYTGFDFGSYVNMFPYISYGFGSYGHTLPYMGFDFGSYGYTLPYMDSYGWKGYPSFIPSSNPYTYYGSFTMSTGHTFLQKTQMRLFNYTNQSTTYPLNFPPYRTNMPFRVPSRPNGFSQGPYGTQPSQAWSGRQWQY